MTNILVRAAGIEPAHPYGYQILSLRRLPIPPCSLGSFTQVITLNNCFSKKNDRFLDIRSNPKSTLLHKATSCGLLNNPPILSLIIGFLLLVRYTSISYRLKQKELFAKSVQSEPTYIQYNPPTILNMFWLLRINGISVYCGLSRLPQMTGLFITSLNASA